MKNLTSILLAVLISVPRLFATEQQADKLYYQGQLYYSTKFPMGSYFELHPKNKPSSDVLVSSLWRGYVATFEFHQGTLALKDIEIQISQKTKESRDEIKWKSVMTQVVPKGDKLLLDWYSGLLVLFRGKYVGMGDGEEGSHFSNYLLLEIKHGRVTGKRHYTLTQFKQFKERQFQAYRQTESYRKEAAEYKKQGGSHDEIDSQIKFSIMTLTSEFLDGKSPVKTVETDVTRPSNSRSLIRRQD